MNTSAGGSPSEDRFALLADAMRAFAEAAHHPEGLLSAIVERTGELLGAFCGFASISEDGWLQPLVFYDQDPRVKDRLQALFLEKPVRLADHPFAKGLVANEHLVLPDVSLELVRERFASSRDQAAYASLDVRTILFVPLRARTVTLGLLTIIRHGSGARPFSEEDIRLARSLADHAALTIKNGRLVAQREREVAAREVLAARRVALSDTARELAAATGDEQELAALVARRIGDVFGDLCIVRRVDADGVWLSATSVHHRDEAVADVARTLLLSRQRADEGLTGVILASGKPMLLEAADLHLGEAHALFRAFVEKTGATSMMVVPLATRHRPVGIVAVCRTRRDGAPLNHEDLALLEDLAAHASVALMNSELLARSQRELAERMRTEEVLRRGFLDAAPDAVLIADATGAIVLANAQAETLFGYLRSELVGRSIDELVPDRYRAKHADRRASYGARPLARPMGQGLDLHARRKDGTEFAAEIMLSPVESAGGVLIAAAVRDVTERRREMDERNRRMEEANRLKSEFLANMSHELRTPLNAIIGFAALMHSGKTGPLAEDHKEYLGDILTSARHLLQLINDILDLAKVESGRMDLQFERTHLETLVREVRDIARGLAAEKRLRITSTVEVDIVEVDARMLKQVLYNYLSNAIKFTRENGTIEIRIVPEGADEFRLSVQDSGIGIATADMGRLFIEFQQLESGPAKRYPGTGLGLALVKRIVEAHSGRVAAESELGEGSTFSAILPRAPRPAQTDN